MFKLNYIILEDSKKELENLASGELDDFEGQIELYFNDTQIGCLFPMCTFYNEYMLWWFTILNEASLKLINNDYIICYMPDRNFRLEMIKKGEYCIVNEVTPQQSSWTGGSVITDKIEDYTIFTKSERILTFDFVNEIYFKTKSFIDDISAINSELVYNKSLKDIIAMNNELGIYLNQNYSSNRCEND